MQTFMVQITRADGTTVQRSGLYVDGLAAAQIARATFPDAVSIKAESFASWAADQQRSNEPDSHDTERLPSGGFYFAPGAVEAPAAPSPSWWVPQDRLGRAIQQLCAVLIIAGLIGGAAGYLQATGWPQ